jgi:hypothetical protein
LTLGDAALHPASSKAALDANVIAPRLIRAAGDTNKNMSGGGSSCLS